MLCDILHFFLQPRFCSWNFFVRALQLNQIFVFVFFSWYNIIPFRPLVFYHSFAEIIYDDTHTGTRLYDPGDYTQHSIHE